MCAFSPGRWALFPSLTVRSSPNVVKMFRRWAARGTPKGPFYINCINEAARHGARKGESHLEPACRHLIDSEFPSFQSVHLFGTTLFKALSSHCFLKSSGQTAMQGRDPAHQWTVRFHQGRAWQSTESGPVPPISVPTVVSSARQKGSHSPHKGLP